MARRRDLQPLRHLDERFVWLQHGQQEKSNKCLVMRTWLTRTRNLQTNVRLSSADQKWASNRSRNSSVMQFCNKFTTIFLSLCHRSVSVTERERGKEGAETRAAETGDGGEKGGNGERREGRNGRGGMPAFGQTALGQNYVSKC